MLAYIYTYIYKHTHTHTHTHKHVYPVYMYICEYIDTKASYTNSLRPHTLLA